MSLDLARLEELSAAVRSSPKYAAVTPGLIERLGRQELARSRSLKDAVKATKNKLHQVAGAYLESRPDYPVLIERLRRAGQAGPQALKAACRQAMQQHASTAERLPILERFYAETLDGLGPFDSVLDIACGFNPLAIPWLPLAPGASYYALDVYSDLMDFLGSFLDLPAVQLHGYAQATDCLGDAPLPAARLALLLKAIPCLEQIDKDAGLRLLQHIQAPLLLVSFPARSLGGRSKGMPANYAAHFQALIAGQPWQVQSFEFSTELVFLVRK